MTEEKTAPHNLEREAYRTGCRYVIGIDEAGRGCLARPVYVGYAVLPLNDLTDEQIAVRFHGVRDSKRFSSESARRLKYDRLQESALLCGVLSSPASTIDAMGISEVVNHLAFQCVRKAYEALLKLPDPPRANQVAVLMDAGINAKAIRQSGLTVSTMKHGDGLSLTIAAASIMAKVERDLYMHQLDQRYPGYGFADHKGYYAGEEHLNAIRRLGIIPEYRRSFEPIVSFIANGIPLRTA